jgi:hypothetical protein
MRSGGLGYHTEDIRWSSRSAASALSCPPLTILLQRRGKALEKGLEAGEGGGGTDAAPVALGEATVVVSERSAEGLRDRWWVVGGCGATGKERGSRERGAPYATCGIEGSSRGRWGSTR